MYMMIAIHCAGSWIHMATSPVLGDAIELELCNVAQLVSIIA